MFNKLVNKFRAGRGPTGAEARNGYSAAPAEPNEAFRRLNELAPLACDIAATAQEEAEANTQAPAGSSQSIVCREAILGRDQRVAGYSFMLRNRVNARVQDSAAKVRSLYDEVLLRNLQAMQIQQLLEHRQAFIALSPATLLLPIVQQLPANGTVYVMEASESFAEDAEAMLARLDELKSQGYRVALQAAGFELDGLTTVFKQADYLLFDIGRNDIPEIGSQLGAIQKLGVPAQFVATNIITPEDFNFCQKFPFSLYQGPFITHREEWNARCLDAGRVRTMTLLNKLRNDAGMPEVSSVIRQDPALAVRLMRYANSAGMGLQQKVGSIEQALMVLGHQQLYRLVTLMLFTGGESNELIRPLLENALIRARLAELLARDKLDTTQREELFLTGMVSLMDVVLGLTMDAVIRQLGLPESFKEALLAQKGKYAPFIKLAIACEKHDWEDISVLSSTIGLDEKAVNALHIEAMVWAQQSID